MITYQSILHFWFVELEPKQWFMKDENLDKEISKRFIDVHHQAAKGELFTWRVNGKGRLAEIIVLDQFSRNIFRDTGQAFRYDSQALILAQEVVAQGLDSDLSTSERSFCYLPFMHSESKVIHEQALRLYQALGNENSLSYEIDHKAIIDRFGRYPHRNKLLDRISTEEERAFLETHKGY
jgi:uncharacterized protein (DUF924 family)